MVKAISDKLALELAQAAFVIHCSSALDEDLDTATAVWAKLPEDDHQHWVDMVQCVFYAAQDYNIRRDPELLIGIQQMREALD